MIRVISRLAGMALLAGTLAACNSSFGTDESNNFGSVLFAASKQVLNSRLDGPPKAATPTREMIANLKEPVLQINPEMAGGSDFLRRAVSRNDSGIGAIEVWNSSVMAHVFLRNGVLVGTRGIGGDIIAADANMTIRALQSRSNSSGSRSYVISDGDVTTTDYQFHCELRNLGLEGITVSYQVYETTHMRESCAGGPRGDILIRNDYWVQPSNGIVRKSRQWVGPKVGYFEFLLLRS